MYTFLNDIVCCIFLRQITYVYPHSQYYTPGYYVWCVVFFNSIDGVHDQGVLAKGTMYGPCRYSVRNLRINPMLNH